MLNRACFFAASVSLIALPVVAGENAIGQDNEASSVAAASLQVRGERAEWRGRGIGRYATARASATVIYGAHQRQQIDIYAPDEPVFGTPLVVYIHGGGWSAGDHKMVSQKPAFFNDAGYVFASAGYRVLPDAAVEQQAADLGQALQVLRAQAEDHDFDPDRIILIGHSAGAHLAALLGSDPGYAGDAFDAIRGVILLDGGGYDIGLAISMPEMEMPLLYRDVFGTDPARHKALSPVAHIGGKDAPNWLIVHLADRAATIRQAEELARALAQAGRRVQSVAVENSTHRRINTEIGSEAGSLQSEAIAAFLQRLSR